MGHTHEVKNYNYTFALAVILNIIFVLIEFSYGVIADSLALIADAGHNLSDVAGLLLAWGATILASKPATQTRTYGFKKATVLASLASAIVLLFAIGVITWESIDRFSNPQTVEGMTIIIVASIGVVINTATALLFVKGQKHDLNLRGAYLHMAADAAISVGVVISGIIIMYTGWILVDPIISLFIVLIIFIGTWGLLRDSTNYVLDSVPKHIDNLGIKQFLLDIDKVNSIHDLHIWPLSTTEIALSVHLIVKDDTLNNSFICEIQQHLHDNFKIEHSTIQIESLEKENNCMLINNHKCN